MEKLTSKSFNKKREFNPQETLQLLKSYGFKFWSWGADNFMNIENKALRFKVNGHHHKGFVFISLNWADLYDVHLTTIKGDIIKELNDLYFDQLFDAIDKEIEYIPEYNGN